MKVKSYSNSSMKFIFLSLFLIFLNACSDNILNERINTDDHSSIESSKKRSSIKYRRLSHVAVQGDYNAAQFYEYKNKSDTISNILNITYEGLSSKIVSQTRLSFSYDENNEFKSLALYKLHDDTIGTLVETYNFVKSGDEYSNDFLGNQIYYDGYNQKIFTQNSIKRISNVRYVKNNKTKDNINRTYSYKTKGDCEVLNRVRTNRNGQIYTQKSTYVSPALYHNPFSDLPSYIIPLINDLFIGAENNAGTPFYGFNVFINNSSHFPQKQIYNIFAGTKKPPFNLDTIVIETGYEKVDGVDYPNMIKVVHTGLDYSSDHPNHTYFINLCYEGEDYDNVKLDQSKYPLSDIFKHHPISN